MLLLATKGYGSITSSGSHHLPSLQCDVVGNVLHLGEGVIGRPHLQQSVLAYEELIQEGVVLRHTISQLDAELHLSFQHQRGPNLAEVGSVEG